MADIFSELNFISQPLARFQLRRGGQCGGPAQVPMRCARAVECESRHDGLAFVSSPHAELGRDPAPDPNQRPEPRPWLQSDIPETDPSARVSSAEAEPSLGECLEPQRATLDHFDADEVSELTFLRKVRAKAEAAAIAVFPDRPRYWVEPSRAMRSSKLPGVDAASRTASPLAQKSRMVHSMNRKQSQGRTWAASRMRFWLLQRDHVPKTERPLEG